MAFWKKLKDRIFTLKPLREDKEKEEAKVEATRVEDKKLEKAQIKLEKQEQKEIIQNKQVDKYVVGLNKFGSSFAQAFRDVKNSHTELDEEFFEELEDILIMADISTSLVMELIDEIKKDVATKGITDVNLIGEIIAEKMFVMYTNRSIVDTTLNYNEGKTNVYIMIGVNGAGKTTSIAKLANKLVKEGKKVLVAAADTFRAGAVSQLEVWVNRVGADIVKSDKENADPASVVFDAVKKADAENYDVLIVDTAGRLQNKVNLMNELNKMIKIIQSTMEDAPNETLLVLDATTGQNGLSQAKNFAEVAPVTGIILTKMDGTSKGGIVLTIKDQLKLPVKYMGLGEQLDDLQEFDLDSFIYGMTKDLIEK